MAQWRWWLPPATLALILALSFRDPFAGDWDALDYVILALRGEPSSMLFGRMLFLFTNHALYRLAHALFAWPPEQAYLLFKYFVIAQSPLAVVAWWTLARDVSADARAATLAAFILALSPFYVIYSGQAMTEIPSILLLGIALVAHLRGLRRGSLWLVLLGAALMGAAVNVRETVGCFGLWLAFAPFVCGWRLRRREIAITALACLVFFVVALVPIYLWYLLVVEYRREWWGWVASMRMESARHPARLENILPLMRWLLVASPLVVVLPWAFRREWRERGLSPLLLLAAIGLFANLMLVLNYSTVINGRYVLTGLPAIAPLMASFLLRAGHAVARARAKRIERDRRAFAYALALVISVAIGIGAVGYKYAWPTIQRHALSQAYRARLELLPPDAVVMAGGQTVAVTYWRGIGIGEWEWIGTGGGWPGDEAVIAVIAEHLRAGRRVFLDTDPDVWSPRGWQATETRIVAGLDQHFRFRRVTGTIYEVRPLDDETARDTPNLERLLPENRIERES